MNTCPPPYELNNFRPLQQEAKNGAALLALALMAVLVVVASALVLGQFPDGGV